MQIRRFFFALLIGLVLIPTAAFSLTCKAPAANVAGNWHYRWDQAGGGANPVQGFVDLVQSSNKVTGAANGWRFVGTVVQNSINMSVVVDGEEVEGYVLNAQGHVRGDQLFAVYTDTQGNTGSFTALRQ